MLKLVTAWFAIVAVLLAPCAWDTDPREIVGVADIIAHMAHSPQTQRADSDAAPPSAMRATP